MMTPEQLDNWFTYHAPTTDEQEAENRYNSWSSMDGWVPWVPGGNSTKQDEARAATRGNGTLERYKAIRAAEFECHKMFAAIGADDYTLAVKDCDTVNAITRAFAEAIDANAPDSADKTAAIRCVRLARNAANERIMSVVQGFPTHINCIAEARRQLVLARWQANSAIACGGK